MYAISKSQLAAGLAANFAEFFNISNRGILIETLQPTITYDANAPAEYLLHSFVVDANGNLMGGLSTAVLVKGDTSPRDSGAWFDIEPSLQGSLVYQVSG